MTCINFDADSQTIAHKKRGSKNKSSKKEDLMRRILKCSGIYVDSFFEKCTSILH